MFDGFQNTPLLWKTGEIEGLKQFDIQYTDNVFTPNSTTTKLRLGKWIEVYTSFVLKQQPNIRIIEENLQIKDDNQTIGELDVLLLKDYEPIHLEIAYKFYLYDIKATYANPLAHWIGPNRKDSFVYKVGKLRDKQLPLLHHEETKKVLVQKKLNSEAFKQYVHFKAQLFLPYQKPYITTTPLNNDCIQGWHLSFSSINELKSNQFYIPSKLDWLCQPHLNVEWLEYHSAYQTIKSFIELGQSPLCWIKDQANHIQKCFITWW